MFVDASAVVAMLAHEPDARELTLQLDKASKLLWSPVTRWETTIALIRARTLPSSHVRDMVLAFGREWSFALVSIGEREDDVAFEAFKIYGKGTGHPAQLNMGDCFAYACAKTNDARLLYKGNDFAHTDLA